MPASGAIVLGKDGRRGHTIAWGSYAGKHEGDPAGGLLQHAMDQGTVVAAPPAYDLFLWGHSQGGHAAPRAGARFPAFPADSGRLNLTDMVTASPGSETVRTVKSLCLTGAGAKQVQGAVARYGDDRASRLGARPGGLHVASPV